MKDVRPEYTPEEYHRLRFEADRLGISMKRLVHDRSLGVDVNSSPLNSAKILSDEILKCREVLNQIIRREMTSDLRLYEDDMIRLDATMTNIEAMVAAYIAEAMKAVNMYGNSEIYAD